MNNLVRNALAVVLFTGVAVPVGYSTAQAGTTETGCHNILEGTSSSFKHVISRAYVEHDPLIGEASIKEEYYADAGVLHLQMPLEAASCTTATYTVVVQSAEVDARGKRKVLRELSQPGDGVSSELTFDGLIDVYAGYRDDTCVETFLRVQDATGRTIDLAPDGGADDAVETCKDIAPAQAYGG